MSYGKFANTEAAEAFTEAVSDDAFESDEGDKPTPEGQADRLKRDAVSWSDADSVEYADEVSELGVTNRTPDVKMAALKSEFSRRDSQYSDMVKEALWGKGLSAAGKAVQKFAPKAMSAMKSGGGKMLGAAKKGGGKMLGTAKKGRGKVVNKVQSKIDPMKAEQLGTSFAPEAAGQGYHFNQYY